MLDRGSRGKSVRQSRKVFLALVLANWSVADAGQPLTLATGQSVDILAVSPLRSVDGSLVRTEVAIPNLDTLG
jgi:hypothetical protein